MSKVKKDILAWIIRDRVHPEDNGKVVEVLQFLPEISASLGFNVWNVKCLVALTATDNGIILPGVIFFIRESMLVPINDPDLNIDESTCTDLIRNRHEHV